MQPLHPNDLLRHEAEAVFSHLEAGFAAASSGLTLYLPVALYAAALVATLALVGLAVLTYVSPIAPRAPGGSGTTSPSTYNTRTL